MARHRRTSVKKHLRTIRRAIVELEATFGKVAARLRRAERLAARKTPRKRRTVRLTPRRRAQLKLQGAYMGTMRQLGPRQKARVKAVKEAKGLVAAIAAAKRIARS